MVMDPVGSTHSAGSNNITNPLVGCSSFLLHGGCAKQLLKTFTLLESFFLSEYVIK